MWTQWAVDAYDSPNAKPNESQAAETLMADECVWIDAAWRERPESERGKLPLGALVDEWQKRPVLGKLHENAHGILPTSLFPTALGVQDSPIYGPRSNVGELMDFQLGPLDDMQASLPLVVDDVMSPFLSLATRLGFGKPTRYRGARLAKRLLYFGAFVDAV